MKASPEVEEAVVRMAFDQPAFGQVRASKDLRKKGIFISAAGAGCVWQRHDLETFAKRLKALEAGVAQDGIILTEAQMMAMERKKRKRMLSESLKLNILDIWDPSALITWAISRE